MIAVSHGNIADIATKVLHAGQKIDYLVSKLLYNLAEDLIARIEVNSPVEIELILYFIIQKATNNQTIRKHSFKVLTKEVDAKDVLNWFSIHISMLYITF